MNMDNRRVLQVRKSATVPMSQKSQEHKLLWDEDKSGGRQHSRASSMSVDKLPP